MFRDKYTQWELIEQKILSDIGYHYDRGENKTDIIDYTFAHLRHYGVNKNQIREYLDRYYGHLFTPQKKTKSPVNHTSLITF